MVDTIPSPGCHRQTGDHVDRVHQSRAPDRRCTTQTRLDRAPILAELHTVGGQWRTCPVLNERVASDRTDMTETTVMHIQ